MKYRLFFMMLLMVTLGQAQKLSKTERETILNQVDTQVWRPFMKALANNDIAAYDKLHAAFVLRASSDLGGKVWSGKDYFVYNKTNFSRLQDKGIQQKIEFGFVERVVSETVVSDMGLYKYTYHSKNSGPKYIYGKFHIISQKVDDARWKIILDYDRTDQEGIYEIGEHDFEKASSFIRA